MPIPEFQTFTDFMSGNPMANYSTRTYLDSEPMDPNACVLSFTATGAQTLLVPTWAPDSVNWPNDIISPIFGQHEFESRMFAVPEGALFFSYTNKLVAGFYYWDWAQGPSIKIGDEAVVFVGQDGSWIPGDYVGGGADGIEVFNSFDGTIIAISDANIWRFTSDGAYLAGPLSGTTMMNMTLGACYAPGAGKFFQLGAPVSGDYEIRRWSIDVPETTGAFAVQEITPVVVQDVTEVAESSSCSGRLQRSQDTLAIVLERLISSPPPGTTNRPLSIYFYDTDLNQIGTVQNVHDGANPAAYLIAFKPLTTGGFAVLYTDSEFFWGDSEGAPSEVFLRMRMFGLDGVALGPSIVFYEMEALSWTHFDSFAKRIAHDFAFATGDQYVVLAETHNVANTDYYVNSDVKCSAFSLVTGTPVLIQTVDVDSAPFYPDEQERVRSIAVAFQDLDNFSVAFNRYEDATIHEHGGRTPLYKRSFFLQRCPPLEGE